MAELRKAHAMRERSPGTWELIVESGRDPVTGKRRQVGRIFRGTMGRSPNTIHGYEKTYGHNIKPTLVSSPAESDH